MPLELKSVVSKMFDQNAYILGHAESSEVVVFDPGFDTKQLLSQLKGKQVRAILLTHGHIDHIAGVDAVKQVYPDAPIVIGIDDEHLLTDANLNVSGLFGMPLTCQPANRLLSRGEAVEYAGIPFETAHIPGHSPGSIVYIVKSEEPWFVIGGDVLFQGSIGRTDFPGGSQKLLLQGIRNHLLTLPSTTTIHPGHGPATTIGQEAKTNPFLG